VDFFIKAVNRFPSREWWGEVGPNGKLRPVGGKVRGFAQLIMKKTGGITERDLTLTFIGMEVVVALVVILFYMR
jgi:hypothetical protein